MESLATASGLSIRQMKEWGEILSGFECRNKYIVLDQDGRELYYVGEQPGMLFLRLFLKAVRPFKMDIFKPNQIRALRLSRPFRFFFHELFVFDNQGRPLGKIERRFSLLRRIYSLYDSSGKETAQLFGPILHPWTFEIRQGGQACGMITKKWSGLAKEMFTDADNFGVTFPSGWDPPSKALLLGAVFLIDFVHFENKNNS
ncbi:MAG: phospholipid scramblase-related protein [Planctomycetota bacterium]